jgi:hypothetical protein
VYRRLTTQVEKQESERAFHIVFQSFDPSDTPFRDTVKNREILFPSDYFLSAQQFEAIMHCASNVGDKAAYITLIEGWKKGFSFLQSERHGVVNTSVYDYNFTLADFIPPLMETAFYSQSGSWGVITSHLNYAVVGGTEDFFSCLGREIDLDDSRSRFMTYLAEIAYHRNGEINDRVYRWSYQLVSHIYGRDRAKQLMKSYGVPFDALEAS